MVGWIGYGQESKDSISRSNALYTKWKIVVCWAEVISFNSGSKIIPIDYDPGDFRESSIYYIDPKEKAKVGYQFSLEAVSKTFFKNRTAIRLGFNFDKYYYDGTASKVNVTRLSWNPDEYSRDTCVDCHKYFYKDYFFTFTLLPKLNIVSSNKIALYYFAGVSIGLMATEVTKYYYREWSSRWNNLTSFGISGLGSTVKIAKRFYLDFQIKYNYQLYATPSKRRLNAAGIKVGFML